MKAFDGGRWEMQDSGQNAYGRSQVDHGDHGSDHDSDLKNTLISLSDHGITGTDTPITPSPACSASGKSIRQAPRANST